MNFTEFAHARKYCYVAENGFLIWKITPPISESHREMPVGQNSIRMDLSFPRRRDSQAVGKHERYDTADSEPPPFPGPGYADKVLQAANGVFAQRIPQEIGGEIMPVNPAKVVSDAMSRKCSPLADVCKRREKKAMPRWLQIKNPGNDCFPGFFIDFCEINQRSSY